MQTHFLTGVVRPTTLVDSPRLRERLGVNVLLATETLQYTGSFKFRAAYNLAHSVSQDHLLTASSGNFGQALAYACKLIGKRCTVVMPETSAKIKIEAVQAYGGEVVLTDTRTKSRSERVAELAGQHPQAYVASAYDDEHVIKGNSTLGLEVLSLHLPIEVIVCPIGGGGLSSGLATAIRETGREIALWGAEPQIANDAARSLRAGTLVADEQEAQTLADGARTLSLGKRNWEILSGALAGIVEVPEEQIREAVKLLCDLANLKVEPTGALSVAAVLTSPETFRGKSVCCIVSGGNVDPALYADLITQA